MSDDSDTRTAPAQAQCFINPKTGRQCKIGGATHKQLVRDGIAPDPRLATNRAMGIPLPGRKIAHGEAPDRLETVHHGAAVKRPSKESKESAAKPPRVRASSGRAARTPEGKTALRQVAKDTLKAQGLKADAPAIARLCRQLEAMMSETDDTDVGPRMVSETDDTETDYQPRRKLPATKYAPPPETDSEEEEDSDASVSTDGERAAPSCIKAPSGRGGAVRRR
jgi:hypothetical protein